MQLQLQLHLPLLDNKTCQLDGSNLEAEWEAIPSPHRTSACQGQQVKSLWGPIIEALI